MKRTLLCLVFALALAGCPEHTAQNLKLRSSPAPDPLAPEAAPTASDDGPAPLRPAPPPT